jgi:hypothetical protein
VLQALGKAPKSDSGFLSHFIRFKTIQLCHTLIFHEYESMYATGPMAY